MTVNGTIVVIVLVTIGVLGPNLAHAHTQEYESGYSLGYDNAVNNISIDNGYFNLMTKHWQIGYQDGWNAAKEITNTNQQSESSSVNIRGNDNRVIINQGESISQGSSTDVGNLYHEANPRCLIICTLIR